LFISCSKRARISNNKLILFLGKCLFNKRLHKESSTTSFLGKVKYEEILLAIIRPMVSNCCFCNLNGCFWLPPWERTRQSCDFNRSPKSLWYFSWHFIFFSSEQLEFPLYGLLECKISQGISKLIFSPQIKRCVSFPLSDSNVKCTFFSLLSHQDYFILISLVV